MVKFKMIESPECVRCGEIETNNHLLYECMYSRRMWNQYNFVIKDMLNSTFEVKRKEDIFNFEIGHIENIIKIRLINELIQIERPKIWTKEKIINMIVDTRNCDKYIAIENNHDMKHFNNKWGRIKVHH